MNNLNVQYSNVAALVKALGRALTVFDLECTAFRGRSNFGITEVCGFSVTLDGKAVIYGHLINPENAIDAKVVQLTGITPAMVRDKETWGVRYAELFKELAATHWMGGFNNKTFDCPAVLDMNARYGHPISDGFPFVLDVRNLYLALEKPKSKKGNLVQVADSYGVKPQGDLHRARADVILTVETLDAMVAYYGVPAIVAALGQPSATVATPSEKTAPRPRTAAPAEPAAIDELAWTAAVNDAKTIADLAEKLGVEQKVAAIELSKAVDEGRANPMQFVNEATLAWLREMLVESPTDLLLAGRLKPLYDHLNPLRPKDIQFDYLQLRIGLADSKLTWASLKAPLLH
jgi:DNA polymerase III epsilon subunit-like protein